MKIHFDNIIYSLQRAGGISTYWGELSKRLIRDKIDVTFIEMKGVTNVVRNSLEISNLKLITEKAFFLKRFLSLNFSDTAGKFIFHSSYNRVTCNKMALPVITIHDFVHEKFYTGIRRLLHSYQKSKAIKSADRVIVISENTKKDLLFYHPKIDPNKIRVIYNGVSEDFFPLLSDTTQTTSLKRKKILFVGSREHYKNFNFVVEVVSQLNGFELSIVGSQLKREEEKLLRHKLGSRWELFNNISNKELNIIYNQACTLLYPSSYEGFGIPPLEAMRAGTPFIALRKSSIPEVAGDAGILLNDLDVESFKNAIFTVESNREALRKKGFEQSTKFSWEKCYQQTLEVYKELY